MGETTYQTQLIKTLRRRFRGCIVLKNDTSYIQGFPDLLILFDDMWAALEVKYMATSPMQPNQNYYVHLLNEMSFADVIFPENEAEVLDDLQRSFEARRSARLSQP